MRAIELLAQQGTLHADDYELLLPIAMDDRLIDLKSLDRIKLSSAFQKNVKFRRNFFLTGLTRDPEAIASASWIWQRVLTKEDIDWLVELCTKRANTIPWLWEKLLSLAYDSSVPQPQRNKVRRLVGSANQDILTRFGVLRKKRIAQEKRHLSKTEKNQEEEERHQYALSTIVTEILNNPKIELREKIHRLGWSCFTDQQFRPTNVLGEWKDLDPKLQKKIFKICKKALDTCKPTRIPAKGPFPLAIIYEAAVFVEILKSSSTYSLDREKIIKWLPAVLTAGNPADEITLSRCLEVDRETAEGILLEKINSELLSETSSITAYSLPQKHWSERLSDKAARFIKDKSLKSTVRADLLRLLANRAAQYVAVIVKECAGLPPGIDEATDTIRLAGLDAMFAIDPAAAVHLVAERYAEDGKNLLINLSSLTGRYPGEKTKIHEWPASLIEILVDVLYKAFPPKGDPHYDKAHFVGPEEELRWLRDGLVNTLLQRDQPDDKMALEQLAAKHSRLRLWLDSVTANRRVQQLIEYLAPPEGPAVAIEGRVPVGEVVKVLEDSRYRIIRSGADLQRTLQEEIMQIEKNVKDHLSMLYNQTTDGNKKERLPEQALQSYIHCRLSDRLPGQVLSQNTQVFLDRETLAGLDRRMDIKVQAPTVMGGRATVVIEIKWSNNRDVSSSLSEQLGNKYLEGQSLTYGIYLVGWYEVRKWAKLPTGISPKKPYTITTWTDALRAQARDYSKAHPAIRIEPIIIDLEWK